MKLKPCRYCGNIPSEVSCGQDEKNEWWWIKCYSKTEHEEGGCGLLSPSFSDYEEVIFFWNGFWNGKEECNCYPYHSFVSGTIEETVCDYHKDKSDEIPFEEEATEVTYYKMECPKCESFNVFVNNSDCEYEDEETLFRYFCKSCEHNWIEGK